MTVLDAAQQLRDAFEASVSKIGKTPCALCGMRAHADACPLLAIPAIVAVVEAAADFVDVMSGGPNPVGGEEPMPPAAWQQFVRAVRQEVSD